MSEPQAVETLVDTEAAGKVFAEFRSRPLSEIETECNSVRETMVKAIRQGRPEGSSEIDYSKIDIADGDTPEEKAAWVVTIHSRLAGVRRAKAERAAMEKLAASIEDGTYGGDLPEEAIPNVNATPREIAAAILERSMPEGQLNFHEKAKEVCEQRGIDLVSALKAPGGINIADVDLGHIVNTAFTAGSSYAPFVQREPGTVLAPTRPVQVLERFRRRTTDQNAVHYMLETTHTPAAAEKSEGTAYAEATYAATEQKVSIERIGHFLPVTEVVMEDDENASLYLNERLPFGVFQKIDAQSLLGSGSSNQLKGAVTDAGQNVQYAKTSDNDEGKIIIDYVLDAIDKVEFTGYAPADTVVLNYGVVTLIMKAKDSTGRYLLDMQNGPRDGFAGMTWGVPVIKSSVLKNTGTGGSASKPGIVGSFGMHAHVVYRKGINVEMGLIDKDFIKDQMSLKAYARVATYIDREDAFCTLQRK